MATIELSVVIPAYNEEHIIEGTIRSIAGYLASLGLSHEIVVIDDGSADSTSSIVRNLSAEINTLRLCSYTPNKGKGNAVRTGMLFAEGERILFTDADNSTPIEELPAFISALESGCEVAIASREVEGAVRTVHQPFYREFGGRMLNFFIRLFAVPGIRDTQCGFKLFTRRAARAIFQQCFINDFSFDVEALYLARGLGYRIAEIPVHWANNPHSAVHPLRDGIALLIDLIRIRLHRYPPAEVERTP